MKRAQTGMSVLQSAAQEQTTHCPLHTTHWHGLPDRDASTEPCNLRLGNHTAAAARYGERRPTTDHWRGLQADR
ncbi:MAG: hypothetical protein GX804_08925 [Lentisphaerae bacterium]|nr:hypothetical protein [Lentisphaerota bacterium]